MVPGTGQAGSAMWVVPWAWTVSMWIGQLPYGAPLLMLVGLPKSCGPGSTRLGCQNGADTLIFEDSLRWQRWWCPSFIFSAISSSPLPHFWHPDGSLYFLHRLCMEASPPWLAGPISSKSFGDLNSWFTILTGPSYLCLLLPATNLMASCSLVLSSDRWRMDIPWKNGTGIKSQKWNLTWKENKLSFILSCIIWVRLAFAVIINEVE